MGERETTPIDRGELLFALDRLALGFESADPHIRHEAKAVARQNFEGIAWRLTN